MLERIHQCRNSLSKSEQKVADAILAAPQTAIHSSIATLAKIANVSEPTVNRFCRRLNTKGFPDFKLALAQSLANGTPTLTATSMKTTPRMPLPIKFSTPPSSVLIWRKIASILPPSTALLIS